MLGAFLHCLKDAANEPQRHIWMKQIAHRVHENPSRLFPRVRQIENVFMERDTKPSPVAMIPHCAQAQREPLGITVLAAGADLCATRYRVPRRLGPFDVGICCH